MRREIIKDELITPLAGVFRVAKDRDGPLQSAAVDMINETLPDDFSAEQILKACRFLKGQVIKTYDGSFFPPIAFIIQIARDTYGEKKQREDGQQHVSPAQKVAYWERLASYYQGLIDLHKDTEACKRDVPEWETGKQAAEYMAKYWRDPHAETDEVMPYEVLQQLRKWNWKWNKEE